LTHFLFFFLTILLPLCTTKDPDVAKAVGSDGTEHNGRARNMPTTLHYRVTVTPLPPSSPEKEREVFTFNSSL
jgi:hypothetical protein